MSAFVVVAPPGSSSVSRSGERLDIFPGSLGPDVFAARTPFWIGYGFAPEDSDALSISPDTEFELFVDGKRSRLRSDVHREDARVVRKFMVARFPDGLPAGWHRFAGRWYDEGRLALTSDRSIEFVER
jgi:hypothetical protein